MLTAYILAGLGLLAYIVLVWFAAAWIVADAMDRWILRGGLWLLGLTGALVAFLLWRRKQSRPAAEGASPVKDDVLFLAREANRRLLASARRAGIADLPLVLVLGESGTTKT